MRKTILLLLFSLASYSIFASIVIEPSKETIANKVMVPLSGDDYFISLADYLKLTPKTYKLITGKRMTLRERLELGIKKKMVRKLIAKGGLENKETLKKAGFFGQWEWHWGGFALGLFLSVVGVLIALFFNDDYKWDRFWTAVKTATVVFLIAGIIIAASGG